MKRDRAALWLAQGRPDDVVTLLQRVLEDERMVRPPPHPRVGNTLRLLGTAYLAQGQADLAEHTLRAARAEFRQLPEWHWEVGETESLLGAALLAQGKREQAQVLLEQGFQTVSNHRGRPSRAAVRAARGLWQIDPDDR